MASESNSSNSTSSTSTEKDDSIAQSHGTATRMDQNHDTSHPEQQQQHQHDENDECSAVNDAKDCTSSDKPKTAVDGKKRVSLPDYKDQVRHVMRPSSTNRESNKNESNRQQQQTPPDFKAQVQSRSYQELSQAPGVVRVSNRHHGHGNATTSGSGDAQPQLPPVLFSSRTQSAATASDQASVLLSSNVVHANLVTERIVEGVPVAAQRPAWYKIAAAILVLIVVAILAVALLLLMGVLGKENTALPSATQDASFGSNATDTAALLSRTEALVSFINNITLSVSKNTTASSSSSSSTFVAYPRAPNFASPPELALAWLVETDPLQLDPMYCTSTGSGTNSSCSMTKLKAEALQQRFRLQQRYALATLWFQTQLSSSWTNKTGWLDADDECEWLGITCELTSLVVENNGQQQQQQQIVVNAVTEIRLAHNNLVGRLPEDIALLNNVTYAHIRGNALTGTLPSSLWPVIDLEGVSAFLGNLTVAVSPAIEESIGSYYFTYPSGATPQALAIRWLLHGDPLALTPDTALGQFRLQQRYALLMLWFQLHLDNSQSLSQDETWKNSDGWLVAGDECDWYGIVCKPLINAAVGKRVPTVTEIDLDQNNLRGSIPNEIALISSVVRIELGVNNLSGSLPSIIGTRLYSLATLVVSTNPLLGGSIPESFGELSNMKKLSVGFCNISGTLPASLGQLVKLEEIRIQSNNLVGSLPDAIGFLTGLRHFSANRNKLTGTLPTTIGSWQQLQTFSIYNNALTGTIPASFPWTAPNLIARLYNNLFSGAVPPEICDLAVVPTVQVDPELECACCSEERANS